MIKHKMIGIDPGSAKSGVIVLEDGYIRQGYNLPNTEIIEFVYAESLDCKKLTVIVEDVRPYRMRITDGIIQTIKFLGEIQWRLQAMGQKFELIPRWEVKQWIFLQFKVMAVTEIENKIVRAAKRKEK